MVRIHTLFAAIFFSVFIFITSSRYVYADSNFGVSLTSEYRVNENGETTIQQHFTLTNKKATVFAKEYSLEVGASQLKNVRVFDEKGNDVPSTVSPKELKTTIGISFPDTLVGEGKSRTFTIEFQNPDTATINGNVLEVYVPKLKNAEQYGDYTVTLKTPKKFGEPARVTPATYTMTQTDSQYVLTFAKNNSESISALFGQKQVFAYTLRYSLQNPTGNIGIAQIALPPDTGYQKVVYADLTPKPKELTRDTDGNWIATYQIESEKNLDVTLQGTATLFLSDQHFFHLAAPISQLLSEQKYWETRDPQIQSLAQKYTTPKSIYDYVVSHLTYDYSKITSGQVTRLGALGALATPTNAACQEFTDLFIALARAAHIPARRATGYAYTENNHLRPLGFVKDVLHAWPEYYDTSHQTWVPVDPTWGNTTGGINYFDQFDFNHVIFAVNGESSTVPYGAGSYNSDDHSKSVDIHFAQVAPEPKPDFTVYIEKQPFWSSLGRNQYTVIIHNNSGAAFYNVPITARLNTTSLTLHNVPTELEYILPYQGKTFIIDVNGANILQYTPFALTLTAQGLSSSHDLETGIKTQDLAIGSLIGAAVVSCVVLITFITGRLLVPRR